MIAQSLNNGCFTLEMLGKTKIKPQRIPLSRGQMLLEMSLKKTKTTNSTDEKKGAMINEPTQERLLIHENKVTTVKKINVNFEGMANLSEDYFSLT